MISIIRFSNHALNRIKEREINIEQVKLAIEEPYEIIDVKFSRKACFRKFDELYLVIIFEKQKDEIDIVTVLKVDEVRLIRYGFSRI